MSAPGRPLVLIDGRLARRRPTSGTDTYIRELRAAIERVAPSDLRVAWTYGPPGLPRRNALTSAANAALDMAWLHVGLPLLARARGARLLHASFLWTPLWAPMPCSTTIHDVLWERSPESFGRAFRRYATIFTRRSVRRARIVISDSEATLRDLGDLYGVAPTRVRVVPLGVRLPPASTAAREPFVLAVGIDDPRKRTLELIAAHRRYWELAVEDPGRCRLVLAGRTGAQDAAVRSAAGPGVEVLGPVSQERLDDLYARATLLVFPSAYEGFGLPPLEAMAAGCPVLLSRASSLPEVGGEVALYLDDVAPEPFARALFDALADRQALADRGKASRERAATFSWDRTAQLTLDAFREALR